MAKAKKKKIIKKHARKNPAKRRKKVEPLDQEGIFDSQSGKTDSLFVSAPPK